MKHSKSFSITSSVNAVSKKIDDFGSIVLTACYAYMRNSGADEQMVKELSTAVLSLKRKHNMPETNAANVPDACCES